ncbi:MAG: type IV pilin protein [Pontibacterium sp.]
MEVKQHKHQTGFTLIELMITVVVIGILVAIAYPSYLSYVQDTRRANAVGELLSAAQWMERQYVADGTYLNSDGNNRDISGFEAEQYTLSVQASSASTYTLQAAPTGAQASDSCGTLSITHIGVKAVSGSGATVSDCW